jgi:hypothetical protein
MRNGALSHTAKLYAVNSITNQITIKLDVYKENYVSWCYFFINHCENFNELKHITGTSSSASSAALSTAE